MKIIQSVQIFQRSRRAPKQIFFQRHVFLKWIMTAELEMQRLKNLKNKSEKFICIECWFIVKFICMEHFLEAYTLSLTDKETGGILDLKSYRLLELVNAVQLKTWFNDSMWVICHVAPSRARCCTVTHCCFFPRRLLQFSPQPQHLWSDHVQLKSQSETRYLLKNQVVFSQIFTSCLASCIWAQGFELGIFQS